MGRPKAIQIDGLMEQASISLAETRYFDAADHAAEAMKLARRAADFERPGDFEREDMRRSRGSFQLTKPGKATSPSAKGRLRAAVIR